MSKINKVDCRTLLDLDYPDLWEQYGQDDVIYSVMMDDGVAEMTGREVCVSVYTWFSAKLYPKTPLYIENTLAVYNLKQGDMMELLAGVCFNTKDAYETDPEFDFEELGHLMKRHTATIYNDLTTYAAAAVSTLSALDYLHLYNHPRLIEIRDKLNSHDFDDPAVIMNSEIYISEAHTEARKFLTSDDETLQSNFLYHLCRSKQIDITQIIKQVVAIGHGCDIDSSIFPKPITTSYARGLRQLYDTGIDSKGGSRSLAWQADPLEQTEYANRESQILVDIVTTLVDEDCGTKNAIPWIVTGKNLISSQGMNYKLDNDDPNEKLKFLMPEDKHLIGKIIWLRNSLTCETTNPAGVCKVCYGKLGEQLPKRSSIGRTGIFVLSSDVSQKVLSLKHDGGTAISIPIEFAEEDLPFVRSRTESQTIYVNAVKDAKEQYIIIPRKYVANLGYIDRVRNVYVLDTQDISDVKDFTLEIVDEDGDAELRNINVSLAAKNSNLTHDFLKYLKTAEHSLDQQNLTVNLKDWNFNKPVLTVPRKHYSMLDFLSEFKKEVQNSDTDKTNLDISVLSNVSLALNRFDALVSERFFINLTHLCVTMRAGISNDPSKGDFRLKLSDTARFGKFKKLTPGRSVATALSHENITSFLYDTRSYDKSTKQFHPYDNIVMGDL